MFFPFSEIDTGVGPYISVFGCDTPVDWLFGLGQKENGSVSSVLVSPLMSPSNYTSLKIFLKMNYASFIFRMSFVNFDLKPSVRVLSRVLVVRNFNHSLIWRRIGPGWSSDGGKTLYYYLYFCSHNRLVTCDGDNSARLLRLSPRTYILGPTCRAGEIS